MILLVVDAHSKWMEAFPVTTASSATTIERLRQVLDYLRQWFLTMLHISQVRNLCLTWN